MDNGERLMALEGRMNPDHVVCELEIVELFPAIEPKVLALAGLFIALGTADILSGGWTGWLFAPLGAALLWAPA